MKHYAGVVRYEAQDFVAKNAEMLPRYLSRTMFVCENPLLKNLFPEGKCSLNQQRGVSSSAQASFCLKNVNLQTGNPRKLSNKRPVTAATQFKIGLGVLLDSLRDKSPHFVVCLKPNAQLQPRRFDAALVKHQLKSQW